MYPIYPVVSCLATACNEEKSLSLLSDKIEANKTISKDQVSSEGLRNYLGAMFGCVRTSISPDAIRLTLRSRDRFQIILSITNTSPDMDTYLPFYHLASISPANAV